jgi:hypothetical protein
MIRRSFRVGLWLGLLLGTVFALVKSLQGQRDARELAAPPPGRWDTDAPPIAHGVVAGAAELELSGEDTSPVADDPVAEQAIPAAQASTSRAEEPWTDDGLPPPAEPEAPSRPRPVKTPGGGRKAPPKRPARVWVEPTGAVCPRTHPVKAKMASGLFHLPGMLNYARTRPDRCYASEDAAIADGLTRSKR